VVNQQDKLSHKHYIMTKVKIGNLQLEASDRYDPVIITSLEQHVTSQIQESKPYDKEANLFLLKLYQFNTSKTNVDFVKKVLILALMYGGATNDFTLATYLIQDKQVCADYNSNTTIANRRVDYSIIKTFRTFRNMPI
jgi:hypothetical protein